MGPGRPRDDFPVEEFAQFVRANMDARGITQTQLAKQSGVPGWLVSRILKAERPAARTERFMLSEFFGFGAETRIKFCCLPLGGPKPMLLQDYQYPRQDVLAQASALLHQGFYAASAREFKRVFKASENGDSDPLLQADAAGRAALVLLEMDNFNEARHWARLSIAKCSECIGISVPEIIGNAPRYLSEISPSKSALATRILSETLHNLCQIYVRQMFYLGHHEFERSARVGLQNSLYLDRRLDLAQPLGNDQRCRAVVEVICEPVNAKLALKMLDQCKDNFATGGLFEAHRVKTAGIVALQQGKFRESRDLFAKADVMLTPFPDARGLSSARYMLSDAIFRMRSSSKSRQQALRYAVSAAALHPYGVMVERCQLQARYADRRELQAEIDDLMAGKGLYSAVHRMAGWMADNSEYTAEDILFRNINLMIAGKFPQVELPKRPLDISGERLQPSR